MAVIAISRSIRISPRKVRIIAEAVKRMQPQEAITSLSYVRQRGATAVAKTIKSAVANAVNNDKLAQESLEITAIEVTEGQSLKRFHPSTRGRIHPYKKRSSTIRVILDAKAVAVAGGKE